MPFCRACGGKSPADSHFCSHCGQQLQPLSEEAADIDNPPITYPETSILLSQPLPSVSANDVKEEEERYSIPLVIPSKLSTTGNVPFVQGTPSVGTVPSVPGGGETVAATLTAGTMAKIVIILATCAAVIFAGIKVIPPILHHPTDTPTTGVISVNAKTVPMPPTQTNCPAPGAARAAVIALLILGKHQNLVYTENADTGSGGAPGILKRYDVTTRQTTQIVQLATTSISNAQISTDGQWILFTSQVNGRAAIQMIRMDGQGLQTLYCAPANLATSNSSSSSLYSLAWSTDQKTVMFIQQDVSNGQSPPLYLLNLAKGTVQKELSSDSNSSITYFPRVWIDNTHIALLAEASSGNSQGESIYVLDTKNGTNQQSNALKLIITVSTACFGFDISPDHKDFFLVRCNINSSVSYTNYQGPSSITTLPVMGGSESTIYTTQTLAVTGLRVISSTMLLISITAFVNNANFSQNGLYTMRVDGTGLTKVVGNDSIGDTPTQNINLNQSSPYTWSVTSRNSSLYSLLLIGCGMHCTFTLFFGSLTGGTLTTLTSGSSSGAFSLAFVGWTTM